MKTYPIKYHVLWIDDEWEKMSQFVKMCKIRGIALVPYNEERLSGIKKLEDEYMYWDAVILDARMPEGGSGAKNTVGLRSSIDRIKNISSIKHKEIPYFVLTGEFGGKEEEYDKEFADTVGGKYYRKALLDDLKELIKNIIDSANNSKATYIRNQFSDVVSLCPDIKEITDILQFITDKYDNNPDCFNKIRKLLEWVMNLCNERGILSVKCDHTNLAECSRFMGDDKMKAIIPMYVQRSLHSCVSICNEGSHRLIVDNDVKEGEAPYLVRSTIFELLNIISWTKHLPVDEKSICDMKAKIAALELQQPIGPAILEGVADFDPTNKCCFIKDCELPSRYGEEFKGKHFYIYEMVDNTKSTKYRKFAPRPRLIDK